MHRSEELGIRTALERLPESAAFSEAFAVVEAFHADSGVDGILVQSPLPAAMGSNAERRIFTAIEPSKDVGGFLAENAGGLLQQTPALAPRPTPCGVMESLDRRGVALMRKHTGVIGRSDIVGKPMAIMSLHRPRHGHDLSVADRRPPAGGVAGRRAGGGGGNVPPS